MCTLPTETITCYVIELKRVVDGSFKMSAHVAASLDVAWNISELEIRTKSVEKTLEPLLTQVTTLVNQKGPSRYGY